MLHSPDHRSVAAVLAEAPSGRRLGIKATIDPAAECVTALTSRGWTPTRSLVCDQYGWGVTGLSHPQGGPVNPLDPLCLPGGSSSGCAVAVSTQVVDAAIGTDTGGSIRIPAAWCGVIGYRPSTGRIATGGVLPLSPTFDTPGMMTRTVDDLLRVLADWGLAATKSDGPLNIGAVRADLPVSPGVRAAYDSVLARLESVDLVSGEVEVDTRALRRTFSAIQMAESVRALADVDPDELLPAVRDQYRAALKVTAAEEAAARDEMAGLDLHGGFDLLILPTVGAEPPLRAAPDTVITDHGRVPVARAVVEPNVMAPLLAAPAVTLPILPGRSIGLQLVGRPGADEILLGLLPQISELLNRHKEIR